MPNALQSNLVFFYSPTQVAAQEAPAGRTFRLGGLVEIGSVKREGTRVNFAPSPPEAVEALQRAQQGVPKHGQVEQGGSR